MDALLLDPSVVPFVPVVVTSAVFAIALRETRWNRATWSILASLVVVVVVVVAVTVPMGWIVIPLQFGALHRAAASVVWLATSAALLSLAVFPRLVLALDYVPGLPRRHRSDVDVKVAGAVFLACGFLTALAAIAAWLVAA